MTEGRHHPAVLAGLLASASWAGTPTLALATPLDGMRVAVQQSLLLQFAVGCAAGVVVASIITFVANRITRKKDVDEAPVIPAAEDEDMWSSSSLNLLRTQIEEDDDPTGDLGRFRTGQITIDLPATPKKTSKESRRARHSANIASVHVNAKSPSRRAGRHFAGAAKQESLVEGLFAAPVAAKPAPGKHFAGAAVSEPAKRGAHMAKNAAPVARHAQVESKSQAAPQQVMVEEKPAAAVLPKQDLAEEPVLHGRERLVQLPTIESRYAKPVQASVPVINSKPEEVIAPLQKSSPSPTPASSNRDQTERSLGVTGRLRRRMRVSVREVLASRLGRDGGEGIPIIKRADGTSTDINPTWFDHTFVPALASLTGAHGRLEDTAERVADEPKPQTIQTVEVEDAPSRAHYISRHVAEVNEGVFPERRSATELEHEDVWEEALANMGETIAQDAPPVFQDVVGGPSTIDDPDGLEAPTGFIPFRVPAAHPEVVDTDTYVDYLLRDELSHNGSKTLRRSSHAHLRVIEGGTNPIRLHRQAADTGSLKPRGRHFAAAPIAREA